MASAESSLSMSQHDNVRIHAGVLSRAAGLRRGAYKHSEYRKAALPLSARCSLACVLRAIEQIASVDTHLGEHRANPSNSNRETTERRAVAHHHEIS
jgi:hypothetical protein